MMRVGRKKTHITALNRKIITLIGLVIIILISIPLAKNITKRYRISQELKELNEEISELENKNKHFKELMVYMESDEYIEEQSRLNLGLKKEGEEVVVVQDNKATILKNEQNVAGAPKFRRLSSNPGKWMAYFFDWN